MLFHLFYMVDGASLGADDVVGAAVMPQQSKMTLSMVCLIMNNEERNEQEHMSKGMTRCPRGVETQRSMQHKLVRTGQQLPVRFKAAQVGNKAHSVNLRCRSCWLLLPSVQRMLLELTARGRRANAERRKNMVIF
jgi:hypothetical protein